MGRIFSGFGRMWRAVLATFGFKVNSAADRLASSPEAMSGTFDNVLDSKRDRVAKFKKAISTLVAQQEEKKLKLKEVSDEVAHQEKLRAGALAQGKKVATKYATVEEAAADPEYQKHMNAFRDFSSTLEEKKKRVHELEAAITDQGKQIGSYMSQLETLMRELEKIAQEKHETIADMIGAAQQREVADMMSGIAQDTTSQDLQAMRDARNQAKASAKVSQTIAGMDNKSNENDYLAAVAHTEADDEFARLMGFKTKTDEVPATVSTEKVSEV